MKHFYFEIKHLDFKIIMFYTKKNKTSLGGN